MNYLQDTIASSATKRRLRKVEWKTVRGTSSKPKRLHVKREAHSDIFHCLVAACNHPRFTMDRTCQKHITQRHSWWFFFNETRQDKLVPTRLERNRHCKCRASTSAYKSIQGFFSLAYQRLGRIEECGTGQTDSREGTKVPSLRLP